MLRRRAAAAALLLAAVGVAVAARADVVERRGSEPLVTGTVTGIDDAGVHVKSELGATHFVPWDRVRSLRSQRTEPDLDELLEIGVDLWRARSRVERGDTVLAEAILERLLERFRGRTHETALVVTEGILRCRLARGAHAEAVIPALETARLRRAGVTTHSYSALPPVIDEDTALCPRLAPVWMISRALVRLERDLASYDAGDDRVIAALAARYRAAARRLLGIPPDAAGRAGPGTAGGADASDHAGVRILDRLLECGAPEAPRRRSARLRLEAETDALPAWAEPWARFAIGRSWLSEDGIGARQRGLVSLLHVPARFERSDPYLAGLALAWVAEASLALNDPETAAAMQAELGRRFPGHPVRAALQPVRIAWRKDDESR